MSALLLSALLSSTHLLPPYSQPSNIVITDEGEVVMIDFGLSVKLSKRKAPQEECGTPNYFSPSLVLVSREEIEATRELWYASDIWGFGASLFYLCTGQEIADLDESDPENSFRQIMAFRCPKVVYDDSRELNQMILSMLTIDYKEQLTAQQLLDQMPSLEDIVSSATPVKKSARRPLQRLQSNTANSNSSSSSTAAAAASATATSPRRSAALKRISLASSPRKVRSSSPATSTSSSSSSTALVPVNTRPRRSQTARDAPVARRTRSQMVVL
jgi:hypothetical protein